MFIPVSRALLRAHDFDGAFREACEYLTANGISNYLHYSEPRRIRLHKPKWCGEPVIDFVNTGIILQCE